MCQIPSTCRLLSAAERKRFKRSFVGISVSGGLYLGATSFEGTTTTTRKNRNSRHGHPYDCLFCFVIKNIVSSVQSHMGGVVVGQLVDLSNLKE